MGLVAGTPDLAITQGTLQLAATKMREETLKNSRLFGGIKDEKTGQVLRNDSYDSGYFDGVKLGGVRIDVDVICGSDRCNKNSDGSYSYIGSKEYPILSDALDPNKNKDAKNLYGETGGFQPIQGEWNLHVNRIPYAIGSVSDNVIESFAGPHDLLGGQIWGWYDKRGNTSQKTPIQKTASDITTVVAIPATAPLALSDLMSSDMMEVLMKIGGQ